MLTWTRKRAFVSWRTGIYAFFPGIYAYFPGKYAHMFGFKMHQVQKCQKWCNYAHVEKNRSKSRNLANEHLFVLFWGYRYTYTDTVIRFVDVISNYMYFHFPTNYWGKKSWVVYDSSVWRIKNIHDGSMKRSTQFKTTPLDMWLYIPLDCNIWGFWRISCM